MSLKIVIERTISPFSETEIKGDETRDNVVKMTNGDNTFVIGFDEKGIYVRKRADAGNKEEMKINLYSDTQIRIS